MTPAASHGVATINTSIDWCSAYVFFASQESSYVTGETLGVTGGKPLT